MWCLNGTEIRLHGLVLN